MMTDFAYPPEPEPHPLLQELAEAQDLAAREPSDVSQAILDGIRTRLRNLPEVATARRANDRRAASNPTGFRRGNARESY